MRALSFPGHIQPREGSNVMLAAGRQVFYTEVCVRGLRIFRKQQGNSASSLQTKSSGNGKRSTRSPSICARAQHPQMRRSQ